MKIVEYMAMGRAVLLPRPRNFEDLIQRDRTGILFRPGDAGDLADGLRMLQRSPGLRVRLGRAARAVVEERLNWRANAARVPQAVSIGGPNLSQP